MWQNELPIENDKDAEVIPNDPELKTVHVLSTKVQEKQILDRFSKLSDWRRAVKAVACLRKFVKDFQGVTQTKGENTRTHIQQGNQRIKSRKGHSTEG